MSHNPYEAPKSELDESSSTGNNSIIADLQSESTWKVFLLSFITLGIYFNHYMLRQSKVINRHLNNQTEVPIALCMIALVVSYISLIDVAVAFTTFYSPEFELFFAVLNIFLSVSNIVIAFKMRNRLNSLLSAKRGDPTYFGGLGTFFFQALHFNFRVNQIYKLKFGQIN